MKKQITSFALAAVLLVLSACDAQPKDSAGGGSTSRGSSQSVSGQEEKDGGASVSKQVQDEAPGVHDGAASSARVPEEHRPEDAAGQEQPDTAGEKDPSQQQTGSPERTPPASQPEPQPQPPAVEQTGSSEAPADSEQQEPTPAPAGTQEDAMAYIGQSASSLIAAIGQPNGSSYAPSCMGGGEDGELYYNGFTVYTYRENGTETVQDVLGA